MGIHYAASAEYQILKRKTQTVIFIQLTRNFIPFSGNFASPQGPEQQSPELHPEQAVMAQHSPLLTQFYVSLHHSCIIFR